jgi:hypothetical protein
MNRKMKYQTRYFVSSGYIYIPFDSYQNLVFHIVLLLVELLVELICLLAILLCCYRRSNGSMQSCPEKFHFAECTT